MTSKKNGNKANWIRCMVCGKKHKPYFVVQAIIATARGPSAVSLLICPGCGHVFVPADVLDRMKEVTEATSPSNIISLEADRLNRAGRQ